MLLPNLKMPFRLPPPLFPKIKTKLLSSRIRQLKSTFNFSLCAYSGADVARVKMRSWLKKKQEEAFSHYGGAGYWPYIGDMLCPYIIISAHPAVPFPPYNVA